ncbi:MAG: hypothetical protein HZA48_00530 [Planctomycetes bacterium]|nr:hypothetical protein [Planctomycetota bacterium]
MQKIKLFLIVIIGVFLINTMPAMAARPLRTEDAWTIQPGHFAFEASYMFWKDDNGGKYSEYRGTIQAGLMEKLDLGIEVPYRNVHPSGSDLQDDIADGLIIAKWRLFNETDETPAFTLRFDYKPHNGDEKTGFGTGRNSYSLTGVMSRSNGPVAYHFNLGGAYRGFIENLDETDYRTAVFYSFAVEYYASKEISVEGELLGENIFGRDGPDTYTAALGAKFAINEGTVLDVSVLRAITSNAPDNIYSAGITIYF